jgi:hypothetical protein
MSLAIVELIAKTNQDPVTLALDEQSNLILHDCSGICLPAPAGSSADKLSVLFAARRQDQVWQILQHCSELINELNQEPLTQYLARFLKIIEDLPAYTIIAALQPAASSYYLNLQRWRQNPLQNALQLVRFFIGAPDIRQFSLIIPPQAFPQEGLYLPHLHVRLHSRNGPVAVQADNHQIQFIWSDGFSITLPFGGYREPIAGNENHLIMGQWIDGWPILNNMPDTLQPVLATLSPQPINSVTIEHHELLQTGLEFLREVWPQAYASCRRFFNSVLIQPIQAEHTTSITMDALHGTLITSLRDPIQIGDALCHEGSHTRLNLCLMLDPLLQDDGVAEHPSPWRSDPRPLSGLLNGVHAFVNVCLYYQRVIAHTDSSGGAEHILELQRDKVLQAWDYLSPRAVPTELGLIFLTDLEQAIERL